MSQEHPERLTIDEVFALIGNARVRFWQCPDHQGRPHRVEWTDDVAHCMTCGRTSSYPSVTDEP
jgi:hypothetical protein